MRGPVAAHDTLELRAKRYEGADEAHVARAQGASDLNTVTSEVDEGTKGVREVTNEPDRSASLVDEVTNDARVGYVVPTDPPVPPT
jgi:hypothetical protein